MSLLEKEKRAFLLEIGFLSNSVANSNEPTISDALLTEAMSKVKRMRAIRRGNMKGAAAIWTDDFVEDFLAICLFHQYFLESENSKSVKPIFTQQLATFYHQHSKSWHSNQCNRLDQWVKSKTSFRVHYQPEELHKQPNVSRWDRVQRGFSNLPTWTTMLLKVPVLRWLINSVLIFVFAFTSVSGSSVKKDSGSRSGEESEEKGKATATIAPAPFSAEKRLDHSAPGGSSSLFNEKLMSEAKKVSPNNAQRSVVAAPSVSSDIKSYNGAKLSDDVYVESGWLACYTSLRNCSKQLDSLDGALKEYHKKFAGMTLEARKASVSKLGSFLEAVSENELLLRDVTLTKQLSSIECSLTAEDEYLKSMSSDSGPDFFVPRQSSKKSIDWKVIVDKLPPAESLCRIVHRLLKAQEKICETAIENVRKGELTPYVAVQAVFEIWQEQKNVFHKFKDSVPSEHDQGMSESKDGEIFLIKLQAAVFSKLSIIQVKEDIGGNALLPTIREENNAVKFYPMPGSSSVRYDNERSASPSQKSETKTTDTSINVSAVELRRLYMLDIQSQWFANKPKLTAFSKKLKDAKEALELSIGEKHQGTDGKISLDTLLKQLQGLDNRNSRDDLAVLGFVIFFNAFLKQERRPPLSVSKPAYTLKNRMLKQLRVIKLANAEQKYSLDQVSSKASSAAISSSSPVLPAPETSPLVNGGKLNPFSLHAAPTGAPTETDVSQSRADSVAFHN